MKIDNQDIIRVARQLRDEENEQLNVRSVFNRAKPRRQLSTWLVTIPAAAIIGFVLGFWCHGFTQLTSVAPLTALVDTVYIKVHDSQPSQDSVAQVIPAVHTPAVSKRTTRRAVRPSSVSTQPQTALGRPVAADHIRYDLLVVN